MDYTKYFITYAVWFGAFSSLYYVWHVDFNLLVFSGMAVIIGYVNQ